MAFFNEDLSFVINGYVPLEAASCPALDPTAAIQIGDDIIEIYQSRIDALIDQLGKHILLNYDPIIQVCPNCYYDSIRKRSNGNYKPGGPIPFAKGQQCTYCKGQGVLQTAVQKCIKALIQWRPRDAATYGISLSKHKGVVRFKTFMSYFDDLVRAKTAISNSAVSDMATIKVRLLKGPVITGLRESRYCISFWELIDD